MRNLAQYPLTAEEVRTVLQQKMEEVLKAGRIGGIDGIALAVALRFLNENNEQFTAFVQAENPA